MARRCVRSDKRLDRRIMSTTPEVAFEIRPAALADIPQVAKLAAQLVRFHYQLDPARYLLVEPVEQGYQGFLSSQLDNEQVVVLVAERTADKKIVGYTYARLEPRNWNDLLDACGKLHDILVDDEARGQRVGEALLRETIARLEALGAPRIVLLSAWQNERAQALFEKAGFRRTMVEMTRESSK